VSAATPATNSSLAPPVVEAARRPAGRRTWPPAAVWLPSALIAAAMLLPLVYLCLRTATAGPDMVALLWRPRTLQLVANTVGLAAVVAGATIVVALPLAWLLARTDLPGRRFWLVALSLPLVIPTYVGAMTFIAALGPRGLLQQMLDPLGLQRLPEIYGFGGAALVLTLATYPYALLILRASLQRLDPAIEEAARSLGAGPWTVFRRVTVLALMPAITAGGRLVALYVLSDFGAVSLLQFESFTLAIYSQYRGSFDRQLAAGLGLVLVALTLLVMLLETRLRRGGRYHRVTPGAARPARREALGAWRLPALAYCTLVVLLALGLPLVVLGYWLTLGLARGHAFDLVWGPAVNSVEASVLAALVAVIAAVPLAFLLVRFPGRLSAALERVAYAGFALPGIVVALSLVFFAANFARPLYQSLALLVFAYVVRFLPEALGAARASLVQINPHLEEASRSLGRGVLQTAALITVPLLRPGLVAGFALVFLTAMKELPATLLLAPTGFKTLAIAVWGAASEGQFTQAAAPSLLLVLVSALALGLLTAEAPTEPT
jgi:iron(III) transport system permease protein